ncbi:hypothetical protein [Caballeronia grimmiae]
MSDQFVAGSDDAFIGRTGGARADAHGSRPALRSSWALARGL